MMQGEQYGTWREFDRLAVHHGAAYGAIRGLLILEAQQILMSFFAKNGQYNYERCRDLGAARTPARGTKWEPGLNLFPTL